MVGVRGCLKSPFSWILAIRNRAPAATTEGTSRRDFVCVVANYVRREVFKHPLRVKTFGKVKFFYKPHQAQRTYRSGKTLNTNRIPLKLTEIERHRIVS
ncbi:hypothetical protein AMR41_03715 [Hapalosiphon sp. MRB220]|nr:hypothetical protein AMR41_03715 [Hapalosiphon sp. MRB220]